MASLILTKRFVVSILFGYLRLSLSLDYCRHQCSSSLLGRIVINCETFLAVAITLKNALNYRETALKIQTYFCLLGLMDQGLADSFVSISLRSRFYAPKWRFLSKTYTSKAEIAGCRFINGSYDARFLTILRANRTHLPVIFCSNLKFG